MEFLHAHWFQIVFFLSSFGGAFAHYLKQYMQDHTDVNFKDWWTTDLEKTAHALIVYITATASALGSDVVTIDSTLYAVAYAGILTGFGADSFNAARKPVE